MKGHRKRGSGLLMNQVWLTTTQVCLQYYVPDLWLSLSKDDKYQSISGQRESCSQSSGKEEQMEVVTPVKKAKNAVATTPTSMMKSSPALTPRSLGSSSYSLPSPITPCSSASLTNEGEKSYHDQLPWLRDENRRDKDGRRPSHPDFNPRTLFVS